MKTITRQEFFEMLNTNVHGTSAITIDVCTIPQMRKTNNPYIGVKKYQSLNGIIGYSYQKAVNRIAEKEGKESREVQPRAWGETSDNRIFVIHKDKTYLKLKVESSNNLRYIKENEEVLIEKLKEFMPEKGNKSTTQQDLDGEVIERTINIENIKAARISGNSYQII